MNEPNFLRGKHPSHRKSTRRVAKIPPVTAEEFKKWIEDNDISLYQIAQALDCTWQRVKAVMHGNPSSLKENGDGTFRIPNSMALFKLCIESGLLLDEEDPHHGTI
jgi:hypothetical protein